MSNLAFLSYSLAHLMIVIWCLNIARSRHASGALLVAMISAGLVYDNAIIGLGATIGAGPVLEALSIPRFVMHAWLTPFMMIAATRIAVSAGVGWAQSTVWRVVVWILVLGGVAIGTVEYVFGLELYPSCYKGILRYTGNLSPTQLCFPDQIPVQGGGPPIPSIVGNVVNLAVGFAIWRSFGWLWLMAGSLVMFASAAVPVSGFGLAPGNGGEVVLMLSMAAAAARFGRTRNAPAS